MGLDHLYIPKQTGGGSSGMTPSEKAELTNATKNIADITNTINNEINIKITDNTNNINANKIHLNQNDGKLTTLETNVANLQTKTNNFNFDINTDQFNFTKAINFNNQALINVPNPTLNTHATNKTYVDNIVNANNTKIANLEKMFTKDGYRRIILFSNVNLATHNNYNFTKNFDATEYRIEIIFDISHRYSFSFNTRQNFNRNETWCVYSGQIPYDYSTIDLNSSNPIANSQFTTFLFIISENNMRIKIINGKNVGQTDIYVYGKEYGV